MEKIRVKAHVRKKTQNQLKEMMSFEDMLPITVKSHIRTIYRK